MSDPVAILAATAAVLAGLACIDLVGRVHDWYCRRSRRSPTACLHTWYSGYCIHCGARQPRRYPDPPPGDDPPWQEHG